MASAKQRYYQRKLELLEAAEAREDEERRKRTKREEDEHSKRMALLDLEIAIQTQQLQK